VRRRDHLAALDRWRRRLVPPSHDEASLILNELNNLAQAFMVEPLDKHENDPDLVRRFSELQARMIVWNASRDSTRATPIPPAKSRRHRP
jgi:hypothetical protein